MHGAPLIRTQGLFKAYEGRTVLGPLDLELEAGSLTALAGPNGAGKTTLIECLLGLRHPDGGEIRICGVNTEQAGDELRRHVGAVLQGGGHHPLMTVSEVLEFTASFHEAPREPKELLSLAGLEALSEKRVGILSKGQQQRLLIAAALVGRPRVLLLDEAATGLDPSAQVLLLGVLTSVRKQGTCILAATHDLEGLARHADRLLLLGEGKLLLDGSPSELILHYKLPHVLHFRPDREIPQDLPQGLPGAEAMQVPGPGHEEWAITTHTPEACIHELITRLAGAGATLASLTLTPPGLDRLYAAALNSGQQRREDA